MRHNFATLLLLLASSQFVSSAYNETLARYLIWPMASAAFSDHPELCVKDNYKDGQVRDPFGFPFDPI